MSELYRARVVRVDGEGVFVEVPQLGDGAEWGPLDTAPDDLVAGMAVIVGSISGTSDDLDFVESGQGSGGSPFDDIVVNGTATFNNTAEFNAAVTFDGAVDFNGAITGIDISDVAGLQTELDNLQDEIDAIGGGGGGDSSFYSVKALGAVTGDGVTDDTTALQAAINASPDGSTVWFPPGVYLISAPIKLKPNRQYLGSGQSTGSANSTIKQKNGANIDNAADLSGMLVCEGWYNNATTSDLPLKISNLAIDGNKSNNSTSTACGIILINFWSAIENCYIYDVPLHAIHLTDVTQNGTNTITNSASENRIVGNKIVAPNGNGINQVCDNGASNLDGFCVDNLISDVGFGGIIFDRSPGWTFRRNHLYGIPGDAIDMGRTFATTCESNYIEDFGGANGSGVYYAGINFKQLDGRGTTVIGNSVSCAEPAVNTSNYHLIRATAGFGQTDAKAIIVNNMLDGDNGAHGAGIVIQHDSGGVMNTVVTGNIVVELNLPYYISGGDIASDYSAGDFEVAGLHKMDYHQSSEGAPAVSALAGAAASAASITGPAYSNDIAGQITTTAKTSGPVAGVLVTVTYGSAYPVTPRDINITPTNAAAAARQLYVSSSSTTAFVVSCGVAPTASQVMTFSYRVTA